MFKLVSTGGIFGAFPRSTAEISSGITTDQRGLARIVNGTVDIGACEITSPG